MDWQLELFDLEREEEHLALVRALQCEERARWWSDRAEYWLRRARREGLTEGLS